MIRHIVFTKFENPDENVPAARALLEALKDKIPEIVSLETGRDFLHSGRSWDMALIVTFNSREDLDAYAGHPEHETVKRYIHAHRTDSATVDYTFSAAAPTDAAAGSPAGHAGGFCTPA